MLARDGTTRAISRRGRGRWTTLAPMPQIHLRAEEGDYAPLVLLPGDPHRARRISERFDDGSVRQVNDHRALYGFTGTYRGTPVSVQTSGMGTPSLSIVVEELLRLGAQRLIRVGTCGGIAKGLRTGDLVVATAACPVDGTTATYLHGEAYAPAADFGLTRALVDAAARAGVEARTGLVASVDVFYNTDDDYAQRWRDRGVLAFEMEASALFYLAARDGVQAACALTVSDVLSEEVTTEESYLPLDELDRAIDRMIDVALEAGTAAGG
jgi:purine-nucleoside phosphorylase